jgi:hypothetical protein
VRSGAIIETRADNLHFIFIYTAPYLVSGFLFFFSLSLLLVIALFVGSFNKHTHNKKKLEEGEEGMLEIRANEATVKLLLLLLQFFLLTSNTFRIKK